MDTVRPESEHFHNIYEAGFRVWSNLYLHVVENSTLPASYLSVRDALHQQPFFPRNLSLKHVKYAGHSRLYATGYSTWESTPRNCRCGLQSFQQPLEIEVAVRNPVSLSIAETQENDFNCPAWFARDDRNYIAILILAWSYILSARWTDVMHGPCSLRYTSSQAPIWDGTIPPGSDQSAIYVDIGNVSPEEARWWAAVLAPGQGWQATMTLEQDIFLSPWSVCLQPSPLLHLQTTNSSSLQELPRSAASFSDASRFLDSFCVRHDIMDQSHAALAAVALFPSMGGPQALQLPTPKHNNCTQLNQVVVCQQSICPERQRRHDWVHETHHLDRLLTLSCNTRGIRPMLLSAFYEPGIECNVVSPWLQGAMAAIDLLADDKPYVLGRMLMDRVPNVAFLWLGATILKLQKKLLQSVRFGQIPIDLHSAVWSGTVQSFIQQPVSNPLVADGCVSRADECRLLFLSQSGLHARVPLCQWRPFGATPVRYVDVEVRVHEKCEHHGLQYKGFSWNCVNGSLEFQCSDKVGACTPPGRSPTQRLNGARQILISYRGLEREKEFISENATRSIFGWLRLEGYAPHEREMWKHEWFDVSDSDEDEDDSCSSNGPRSFSHVNSWIANLES